MEQLANALWRERALLELVLFRLIETRLLLDAGETRFLVRASREVARGRQRTRASDLIRAAVVGRLMPADGPSPTLRGLADEADEPWGGILRDHHDAMCALVAEIETVAHHNARHGQEGLDQLDGPVVALSIVPEGATAPPPPDDADLVPLAERAAYEAVLGAAARLRMPALLQFLR